MGVSVSPCITRVVFHDSLRVYAMLWSLFREVGRWFPDEYVHLGGDEVPFDCWKVRLAGCAFCWGYVLPEPCVPVTHKACK